MRALIVLAMMFGVASADVTVTVRSTTDHSQSTTGLERKKLEGLMRLTIERIVARGPIKLDGNRKVDASIESLTAAFIGSMVVVTAEIRVVVTDDAGRITSVLGTSAKVESTSRGSRLSRLREDAVVGALEGGYAKVKDRLHGSASRASR
jgi:hypothetical protein